MWKIFRSVFFLYKCVCAVYVVSFVFVSITNESCDICSMEWAQQYNVILFINFILCFHHLLFLVGYAIYIILGAIHLLPLRHRCRRHSYYNLTKHGQIIYKHVRNSVIEHARCAQVYMYIVKWYRRTLIIEKVSKYLWLNIMVHIYTYVYIYTI